MRAWLVIESLVLQTLNPGAKILDLCCGTGHMARLLLNSGFQVTGIDASDEMLTFSRQNAPAATFVRADARAFDLALLGQTRSFDAVISTFNSFAHLPTTADLSLVFRNVRDCLHSGAPFLFDINMEEAYFSRWHGSFGLVADDRACVVQPSYDHQQRIATNRITIFETQSPHSHSYSRSEFTITQKCHSESDLRAGLHCGGFATVQAFDAERDLGMIGEAGRTFFLCR
ncbi:MAG TPA: class I SAM-dependent methyltransferase [Terriglobales bacterium]|nr:class I SAM-dependent methyltransferase [Terriglobales bacterium]